MSLLPHEAAEARIKLSQEYSELSSKVAILEAHQASYFNLNRELHKSDTACERAWKGTEEGIAWIYGRARCKAIEKEMSALNTFLRLKENEAKNFY